MSSGEYGSILGVPEMGDDEPHDSFAVDVYCLGKTIEEIVIGVRDMLLLGSC